MSNPRLRRLGLDYERLHERFRNWAPIEINATAGDPPEQYRVVYHIGGLYSTGSGQILEQQRHVVEINLSLGYPRRAPQCKMVTPIFHPNFDDVSVCIGDFWAASEGLDDLIIRIGRMIAYQEYNVRSPLNGLAAKWAAQNAHLLPVDQTELAPPAEVAQKQSVEKIVVDLPPVLDPNERFAPPPKVEAPKVEAPRVEPAPDTRFAPPPLPVEPIRVTGSMLEFPRLDFGPIAFALHPGGRVTVGSLAGNDIVLPDPSVGGFHAEVIYRNGEITVRDMGMGEGTMRNGEKITEAKVAPGDLLCFGIIEASVIAGR